MRYHTHFILHSRQEIMPNHHEVDLCCLAIELQNQKAIIFEQTAYRIVVEVPEEIKQTIFSLLASLQVTRRYEEGLYIIERKSTHTSAFIPNIEFQKMKKRKVI